MERIEPSPDPRAESGPELEYRTERAAFQSMLHELNARYGGRFVAVHGGKVVDDDASRAALSRRFFERFGDVAVYIGYVGQPPVVRQTTPFRR